MDRRALGAVRAAGRARECPCGSGLRVLVAGDVSAGGASDGDMGEVRGAAGRRADREQGALAVTGRLDTCYHHVAAIRVPEATFNHVSITDRSSSRATVWLVNN